METHSIPSRTSNEPSQTARLSWSSMGSSFRSSSLTLSTKRHSCKTQRITIKSKDLLVLETPSDRVSSFQKTKNGPDKETSFLVPSISTRSKAESLWSRQSLRNSFLPSQLTAKHPFPSSRRCKKSLPKSSFRHSSGRTSVVRRSTESNLLLKSPRSSLMGSHTKQITSLISWNSWSSDRIVLLISWTPPSRSNSLSESKTTINSSKKSLTRESLIWLHFQQVRPSLRTSWISTYKSTSSSRNKSQLVRNSKITIWSRKEKLSINSRLSSSRVWTLQLTKQESAATFSGSTQLFKQRSKQKSMRISSPLMNSSMKISTN